MALRPLVQVPDPRLRQISQSVESVDKEVRRLMDDMVETMHACNGIGLAAIQVGVAQRIVVIDLAREESSGDDANSIGTAGSADDTLYFVNPEILWHSEELASYQEGCLSVPEFFDDVDRPARCRVGFLDYDGKTQVMECDGLLATCIQHEMDHLNGILFIDHLSRLKKQMIVKKLTKRQAQGADTPQSPAAKEERIAL